MAEKFRNKYRVQTTRLFGYDYTRNGAYFITICTKKFTPYFGEIKKGNMTLSETGIIVNDFWFEIPYHFPNAQLDEFIIMPDHIHGIIIIKSKSDSKLNLNYINVETPNLGVSKESTIKNVKYETPNLGVSKESTIKNVKYETPNLGVSKESTIKNVKYETPNLGVSTNSIIKQGNKYWKSNSIGSIINQFKRICTIKVKSCGLDLSWQPRFYDHIIRSDNEIDRIRTYIKNNPNNWLNDV
jgi:REP element-mobilizing transposase RayT